MNMLRKSTTNFVTQHYKLRRSSPSTNSAIVEESDSLLINWKNIVPQDSIGVTDGMNTQCAYKRSRFHYMWLRDNCKCPECFNPQINQRVLNSLRIPDIIHSKPKETSLYPDPTDLQSHPSLSIVWEDGHKSLYPAAWLMKNVYEHDEMDSQEDSQTLSMSSTDKKTEPVSWTKDLGFDTPRMKYEDLIKSDESFLEWSNQIERYGFSFVEETPLNESSIRDLYNRIGLVRNTLWGDFYVLGGGIQKSDDGVHAGRDAVFSSTGLNIEPHTDGAWFNECPGLQLFQVLHFDGSMQMLPENVLIDGLKIMDMIKKENPYHFRILSSLPLTYHYTDKKRKYSASHIPIQLDPDTGKFVGICFNYTRLSPLDRKLLTTLRKIDPKASMKDIYAAINTFTKVMNDRELHYRFVLKPGTALIADNYRLMHARSAYKGRRLLRGGYTNIEDWRSKVTALREELNAL